MTLLFRTSESTWSVRVLHDVDRGRILTFLGREPLLNVFLLSKIQEEGLTATHTVEVRSGDRTICVASLGGNVILAAARPRERPALDGALSLVAERILNRSIPVRAIVSEADLVEGLWTHLRRRLTPPTVSRLRQPVYALEHAQFLGDLDRVRYGRPGDLDLLVPACAAMHREEVGIDPLERDAFSYRERVRELIAMQRSLVQIENGEVVFKCELSAVTDEAVQLMGVWTSPRFRNRGLAGAALREICGHLLRRGRKVTLFVNDFNLVATRLYERLGFRVIGENRALIW
ncbi:MAG: GNAT family N-acetyltransferase [Acidobacteriota bacterium]